MSKIDFRQYIIELDSVDSTNNYLKNNYHQLPNYTIVKAKHQTKGHGQFGRVWESNDNENLLLSILIKKELPFVMRDANPIIISAILNLLDDLGVEGRFKYPNDIYVEDKKISGILMETKYTGLDLEYLIIGIGINVNQVEFENSNAISLKQILKSDLDIDNIFKQLLKYLSNSIFLANLMYLVRMKEN